MYDKVKMWIDRAVVGCDISTIANYLDRASQQIDLETGETKTFGILEGLKVSVYVNGLSIIGSLPKFLYGSNVYPLDRRTSANAVEKISDTLHIDVFQADITGIEFGTNFLMKHPVTDYLSKLGEMPRLSRYHFDPNTLYYKGMGRLQPKVFAFYDKIADAASKGLSYPEDMKGANLLRYEMRLNGRLSHQLNVSDVRASTLSDVRFYRLLMNRYQSSYYSIRKQGQVKTDIMSDIKNVSDAFNVLVARLINQSDQSQILGFVDELREAGVFADRKYYSRLKKKIQEVASKADISVSDELMRELDNEIKNCGAYV